MEKYEIDIPKSVYFGNCQEDFVQCLSLKYRSHTIWITPETVVKVDHRVDLENNVERKLKAIGEA